MPCASYLRAGLPTFIAAYRPRQRGSKRCTGCFGPWPSKRVCVRLASPALSLTASAKAESTKAWSRVASSSTRPIRLPLAQALQNDKTPLVLILDGVTDPQNLGH